MRMIDRRTFLTGSIACAGAAVTWPARGAAETRAAAFVLVDRHLDGSRELAANARARGLRLLEFAGDAAGVWMSELEPRLRSGPLTVAGYTSAATLFCLDLLARDYGARTVQHTESDAAVEWLLSSSPARRAALAPTPSLWRAIHA